MQTLHYTWSLLNPMKTSCVFPIYRIILSEDSILFIVFGSHSHIVNDHSICSILMLCGM